MEEFLTEENIVKDEFFKKFKDQIICPICQNLMIIPMECSNCQNLYCEVCIEQWRKKGGGCPNHCINSEFKKVIEKKRMISNLKFKCIKGCGAKVLFNDIKNHYNSECYKKKRTMKLMNKNKVTKYCKKHKISITYFERKNI
jgi:E3 ubiquitin-protein ligase NRDP1